MDWGAIGKYFGTTVLGVVLGQLLQNPINYVMGSVYAAVKGSDVSIAGNWRTFLEGDGGPNNLHENVELHQLGEHVWGRAVATGGQVYDLDGKLYTNLLLLNYKEQQGFDAGAILLQLKGGNKEMIGYESGLQLGTENLYSRKYRWVRP